MADAQIKFVDEKAKGMGKALTLCKITVARFDESKPFAQSLGGVYKAGFDKAYADAVNMLNKAV